MSRTSDQSTHAAALSGLVEGWEARLTPTALATARMGFLDALGCILAGAGTPEAALVRELAVEGVTDGPCSVLGTRLRASAPAAAMANGVAGHILDYDDMNATLLGHPSTVLAPTLLAVGEARGASGRDVLSAYVFGFEVDTYFGRLMIPSHYRAGWHATSSLGVFGAAAAAARLLGLDGAGVLNALAIAASNAGGLRANFGTMTKSLHAGQAAETGVRAAMLSARGFTANPAIFDDPEGFVALYRPNETPMPPPPDGGLEVDRSAINLKPYACCGAGISLIDAVLDIRHRYSPQIGRISAFHCAVAELAASIMPLHSAANALEAKYCLEYCAAVALIDGRAGLAEFDDARVVKDDVQALARKVNLVVGPDLAVGGGLFGVEVAVTMTDGQRFETRLELPLGHHRNQMSREQRAQKFLECAAGLLGEARAKAAIDAVEKLEALPTIRELSALLGDRGST